MTDTGAAVAPGGVVVAGGVPATAGGVVAPGGVPATGPAAATGNGDSGGGGGLAGHLALFRFVMAAQQTHSLVHTSFVSSISLRGHCGAKCFSATPPAPPVGHGNKGGRGGLAGCFALFGSVMAAQIAMSTESREIYSLLPLWERAVAV